MLVPYFTGFAIMAGAVQIRFILQRKYSRTLGFRRASRNSESDGV